MLHTKGIPFKIPKVQLNDPGHLALTYRLSSGQLYHAVVEFAPYQRVPTHRKPDPRQNSIKEGTFLL
jgi:hypothetical protein